MYKIIAPNEEYSRNIFGIQFVKGLAKTENEVAAGWFSGREGFNVFHVATTETSKEVTDGELEDEESKLGSDQAEGESVEEVKAPVKNSTSKTKQVKDELGQE